MIQNNIDITDAALNTNAPFQSECPLRLWGSTLPIGAFLGIKIYLPETAKPPVRLYSITDAAVEFRDSVGAYIGSWNLTSGGINQGVYVLDLIKNENQIVVGHVAVDLYTAVTLRQAAALAGGTFYTTPDDFLLLPQCHVQAFTGVCRALKIAGTIRTQDTTLYTGTRIQATVKATSELCTISLYGTYNATLSKNRICQLVVDATTYDVQDKHLFIIPGAQSNLRIVRSGDDFILQGVKDVQ